jgi:polyhydroxyalkanoate synthesis regulator phasin
MLVTFDTQEVVNQLKENGFTAEQAEVLTKIQKQVIHESMDSTLATKGDVNQVRDDIQNLTTQITVMKWMLGIVVAVEVLPLLKQLF